MSASQSVINVADGLAAAAPSCVQDATTLCDRVYELFGLDWLAANAEAMIAKPAKILLIIVLAAIVRLMLNRGIRRLTDRTATGTVPSILRRRRGGRGDRVGLEQIAARRTQRAEAIGSVLRSCASFLVLGIAVVLVLGELGV